MLSTRLKELRGTFGQAQSWESHLECSSVCTGVAWEMEPGLLVGPAAQPGQPLFEEEQIRLWSQQPLVLHVLNAKRMFHKLRSWEREETRH